MVILDLPWFPSGLMPNAARGKHWAQRGKLAAKYRWDCFHFSLNRRTILYGEKIPVSILFIPPDNRKRDIDGCLTAIKSGIDGMCEAWGIDDNRLRPVTLDYADEPVKGGIVRVSLG